MIPAAGRSRKMIRFRSRNTLPVSGDRLCLDSARFSSETKKLMTGFGHCIPASMFRPFYDPNRPVRLELDVYVAVEIKILISPSAKYYNIFRNDEFMIVALAILAIFFSKGLFLYLLSIRSMRKLDSDTVFTLNLLCVFTML